MPQESLYFTPEKIHPKYQRGFFRTLRWVISTFLLVLYFGLPWVRWERPGPTPDQAVFFDLPGRKFFIFDLTFWPQDVILLAFLLIAAAVFLFFITALAGRVFCGYFCIQTVWTDLFLLIEKVVEGNYKRRIKRDSAPWSVEKILRKGLSQLLFILVSLATGMAFVTYFADAPVITWEVLTGQATAAAWWTLIIVFSVTYAFAGFAREQVCIYMCPYARFQGVMFDADTLIVAYDEKRGEPRMGNRRQRTELGERAGDCIGCRECVVVCPTGIDIRDGQQYQCITCAMCVDACNEVMGKVGKPKGLIRYTSMQELNGMKTRFLRPRVLIYSGILLATLLLMGWFMATGKVVDFNIIRQRKPIYIELSDGGIQNNYTLHLMNMSDKAQRYAVRVEGLAGTTVNIAAVAERDGAGHPVLAAEAGDAIPYTLYLRQAREQVQEGSHPVTFILESQDDSGGTSRYESVFVTPRR